MVTKAKARAKPKTKSKPAKDQPHFFAKELAGENPLLRATARRLYKASFEFAGRAPWNVLTDQDLILVKDPKSEETCYCSVMGALGEVYSLFCYIGSEGLRIFQYIATGAPITPGEFFAFQQGVSVEFVPSEELTTQDRQMLRDLGHKFKRGLWIPLFRAFRPRYYPWYPTEEEGQILAHCLETVTAFYDEIISHPPVVSWCDQESYPMVELNEDSSNGHRVHVVHVDLPDLTEQIPEPPPLDSDRVSRIRKQDLGIRGIHQIGVYYGMGKIGRRNERNACGLAVLAVDAQSAFAYSVDVLAPDAVIGESLSAAVLEAIETSQSLPQAVHVSRTEYAAMLAPLGRELGFPVKAVESMPALEFAIDQLEQYLDCMIPGA